MPLSMFLSHVSTGNVQKWPKSSRAIHSYAAQPSVHTDAEKGSLGGSNSESKNALLLHAAIGEPVNAEAKEMVESLLNRGVDPNVKTECGCTALHHVVNSTGRPPFTQGHVDIVDILVERGADVKNVNRHGNTPLGTALKTLPTKDRYNNPFRRHSQECYENASWQHILSILKGYEATPRSRRQFRIT